MHTWTNYPTFEATPMPRPAAVCTPLAHGAWHIAHPTPLLEYYPQTPDAHPVCWLDALKRHRDRHTPMMCQKDALGQWRSISWHQMWQSTQALATHLLQNGFTQSMPIATLSGNSIELAILRFACMLANIPMVHISPAYSLSSKDFAHLSYIFNLTQPCAVFVQSAHSFNKALQHIHTLIAGTTKTIDVIDASESTWAQRLNTTIETERLNSIQHHAHDTCAIYFTSGSTGAPKGVAITHGMLSAQLMMVRTLYHPEQRGPVTALDWLPWHHVFAGISTLSRLLELGGTYYIDDGRPIAGQFEATLANLRHIAPSFYSSTPLAFARLIPALEQDQALAEHFFSKLEFLGYGGASLPRESWERMQALAIEYRGYKLPFLSGFGTTESAATGMALYWPSDDAAVIGLPYPGVELKLIPLQDDSTSRYELRMRGPHMFTGYLGRPDLNAQVFDEQGYYKLGDAVRFADPDDILRGLRFAGRVAENFKLASGTWVNAGALRMQAISHLSPLITDCIVCGRDLDYLALMAWPNEMALRALAPELNTLTLEQLCSHPIVLNTVQNKLKQAASSSAYSNATTFMRAALLSTPASIDAGEITDKGYINQTIATQVRTDTLTQVYAATPPHWVVCI